MASPVQSPPLSTQGTTPTAVIYTVGEVLISLITLIGGMYLLLQSGDEGVRLTAAGLLTGVTVFWFQRRTNEQSTNNLTTLADGKLTQLLQSQSNMQSSQSALIALMATTVRSANESVRSADAVVAAAVADADHNP